jgi:hypothetical protein
MSDNIEFRTKEELYNRVVPALSTKVSELRRAGIKFVKEKDIWDYLVEHEWRTKKNLELHTLINDILFINNEKISDYVTNRINMERVEKIN